MCGIIGYIGGKNAAKIVYDGLKKLEYRGYDSAGVALEGRYGIKIFKRQGRVEKLAPCLDGVFSSACIGHTRWATHGKPSDINAHPHSAGKIHIVHNGIIENYAQLKSQLAAEGEKFISETDSEVVAKLINKFYCGNLVEALSKAVKLLKGSYALMVMCEGVHGIAAAKYKSPLILGFGDGFYLSSDEPALAGECLEISILSDGDIAFLSDEKAEIYDENLQPVARPRVKNSLQPDSLDLKNFPHFMIKELLESPAAVKNTLTAFEDCKEDLSKCLSGVKSLIFTGCGTAYHAALVGARYFEIFAKIPVAVETAGELRYKDPVLNKDCAVFVISQSGETADAVEAANLSKLRGAKVVAVTNSPRSALTRLADIVVPVCAGAEICVAATKSYLGQIAALYLAALNFSGVKDAPDIDTIPELIKSTLAHIDLYSVAHLCAFARGVYFSGRDLDYAVALEASLKLKEVSYIPGEGYSAAEFKHGTLALIDGRTVSAFIICDESLSEKTANAVEQVLSRGGIAAVFSNQEKILKEFKGRAATVALPPCDKLLSPFVSAAALQKLAYDTAVILGRNPDKPRNLAKSVTVE